MNRILLVEDDQALINILELRFKEEGYEISIAQSASAALEHLGTGVPPHLAMIDVGLPDRDGFEVARALRERFREVPFVFLTAMGSPEYRLEGYELGASDYIPKPFHFKELLLRVKRILGEQDSKPPIELDSLRLDPKTRQLTVGSGSPAKLTEREFHLLYHLIENSPRILSRNEVLEELWKADSEKANARTVDNTILRLRQAVGEELATRILSVRGAGYQWSPK